MNKNIEKILFKVTGDLVYDKKVLERIFEETMYNYRIVEIVHGCGTQISEALNKANINFEYVNGIRKTTPGGLKIAFKVSDSIRSYLEQQFMGKVKVYSPLTMQGNEIINTNSDEIVKKICHQYDKIYVCTKNGRDKRELSKLPNLEVLYFE